MFTGSSVGHYALELRSQPGCSAARDLQALPCAVAAHKCPERLRDVSSPRSKIPWLKPISMSMAFQGRQTARRGLQVSEWPQTGYVIPISCISTSHQVPICFLLMTLNLWKKALQKSSPTLVWWPWMQCIERMFGCESSQLTLIVYTLRCVCMLPKPHL